MTQSELWQKIHSFQIDDSSSSFTFTKRLARDNDWSFDYSKDVVEEYKKFLYLCCCNYGQVTPSDQVDQAWHLHLTYTKSYWVELCRNTIGTEVHHNPTKGGNSEEEKFSNCYDSTLDAYELEFGHTAPTSIWPSNEQRFSEINFKRINLSNYWLIDKPLTKLQFGIAIISLLIIGTFVQSKESVPWLGIFVGIIALLFIVRGFFSKRGGRRRSRYDSSSNSTDAGGAGFFGGFFSGFWGNDNDDSGCSSHGCSSGCGGGGCGSGCGD